MNTETSSPGRARRRVLFTALALAGAGAAVAYGILVTGLSFGAPLVMMGLGGLALVLTGLSMFRTLDPLLRPQVARVEGPRGSARVRELEYDKQLTLKAIREVEHDFQMRKISEPDYQEMIQRYRARAMRLIRELDAGDNYRVLIEQELKMRLASIESAAAKTTCGNCGLVNDPDARFCKKCGKATGPGGGA